MTTKTTKISVFILAIIMGSGIAVSTGLNSAVFAQNATQNNAPITPQSASQSGNFTATLSGQNEVPPTQSQATGNAEFRPSGDSVGYIVNASNIQNITAGHIHVGAPGENGPIVVTLFNFSSAQDQYSANGATINASDLQGLLEGQQISDLVSMMKSGNTYVNIHTTQNPNGEIRGQITNSTQ
jgi:hypothetical protein